MDFIGAIGVGLRILRGRWRICSYSARLGGLLCTALLLQFISSAPTEAARSKIVIIKNDGGGRVRDRLEDISNIKKQGARVEIRGKFCISACTMYIGVENTCTYKSVMFGFHGPSSGSYGLALPPERFEYWSQIMAAHYPEPLRNWYLTTGRNVTVGYYRVSGEQLIRLGIIADCLDQRRGG